MKMNMESEKMGRNNFGGSLQVESVQAPASKGLKNNIPRRYIRPHLKLEKNSVDDSQSIPIIDMSKLENIHESLKLHHACKDWGFFQLINHGISDVIDEMKGVAEDFFKLPQEEKMVYAQVPGDIEGYGQANVLSEEQKPNVLSEEQKLDWSDMLAIMTRPLPIRNMRFWPTSPPIFRSAINAYSCKMEKVEIRLLRVIAKNLGIGPSEILVPFENGFQAIRSNYYPPYELADEVIGFTPHSDASGLTLLVQVNDVSGLQIKKDEKWVPVKSHPGAIIVNVGDIMEIMSNGEYKSIEHRAMVNTDKERVSIASFQNLNMKAMVGPISELLMKKNQIAKYKTITHEDYIKLFLSTKLNGKDLLDQLRI